ETEEKLSPVIKTLFYNSIIYHDFGKINHLFQKEKMSNLNPNIKERKHKEGSNHSSLSAYLFLVHNFKYSDNYNFNAKNQTISDFIISCFSFPIYKHHSSYLSQIDAKTAYSKDKIEYLKEFLEEFEIELVHENLEYYHDMIGDMENTFLQIKELKLNIDFFPLFVLLKLNYSLLTASDYYATSDYMNDLKFNTEEDFGLITVDLKKRIFHHFKNNKETNYNGELIRNPDKYLSANIDDLREISNKNLNFLRQKLGAEVLTNIEKHKEKRVFYIEAPTGGGKTNMSMIAVIKLLEIHSEINKVFYVFPFTTLITQTAKAIKETLGLNEQEIAQVHSKAGYQSKSYDDAKYGNEHRNQIDNLFVNYPFTLLTHIKFFDILKSNKKDTNYLLHRLANSIVIIDELQSYNPDHWDKILYFISQYAELFNIRFIIMSATLPKIDEIKFSDYNFIPFERLIPNAKKYLQNPNFAKRVNIKTDLLNQDKIELQKLADILFEKTEEYAKSRTDKYKNSVYTIIEFIFKKSASEFYNIVNEQNDFFDEIFVLSGTIIEPRRKYIIEFLKDEDNRKKKILLITTQVVEAGVNIDMDLGFKNQSLIDSDEQLAGRINRNVDKENCELWLFKHDTPKSIYGKDLRYQVTQKFEPEYIKEILTNKDFEKLYEKVFEEIDKLNDSNYKTNLSDYLFNFKNLKFKEIHNNFKLIDSENASIFVPEDIDINCYNEENNFSGNEIQFIKKYNCLSDENETKVSGEKIWELYVSLIRNKEIKFSNKKIKLLIINGIMSKFVFSVFIKKKEDLKPYLDYNEQNSDYQFFQYFKLLKSEIGKNKVYNLESGINEKMFDKSYDFF
ncbi:MAG: CRISPR-associated helicase Cas3', partial [Bacteroidales bacterium]|nr:CRISPR-associated helicase Cas3' [Bacteroidales bacterium]